MSGLRGSRTRLRSAITSVSLLMPPPRLSSRSVSVASTAAWPVSDRNTSSSVGVRTTTSSAPTPARDEPPRGLHDRAVALGHLQRDDDAVGVRRLLAHALQRRHRGERRRLVRERDLEPLAADAALELVRGALGDHAPVVDDRDPVRQPVGLLEVLRRQQHGRAVGDEVLDRLPQLDPRARVQARRRLVEEQHRRRRDERRREVQPPPHAAAVGLRGAVGGVGEREALEQLVRAPLGRRAPLAVEPPDHRQVLGPGQVLVDGRVLAREADLRAQPRRVGDDVEAGDARAARVGLEQRREHAHHGRLSGPVRSQHAEDGPRRGLQVDAVEGPHGPERLHEALDADGRLFVHSHAVECSGEFRPGTVRKAKYRASRTMSETTSSRLLTAAVAAAGPPRLAGLRARRPAGGLRRARSGATSSGCARSATRSSR